MKQNISTNAKAKLFAGFLLSSELKMHLHSSPEWKTLAIMPEASQEFQEIHYDNLNYVGHYLAEEKLTIIEIKAHEVQMTQKLLSFCPKLDSTHLKFTILSQIFIH